MFFTNPQIIYLILVLPGVLGITLIADGINKMVHEESGGAISFSFGALFLGIVVLIYFFFSNFLRPAF